MWFRQGFGRCRSGACIQSKESWWSYQTNTRLNVYSIEYSWQFKKSLKLCKKRGYSLEPLQHAIAILSEKGTLPPEYKPHILSGKYAGIWNVTLSLIGFYFGNKITRNLFYYF